MATDESRVAVRKSPLEPSEGQSRGYHRANLRRQKDERNITVLEMWKNGMNSYQIAKALERTEYGAISRSMVDKIVKRELEKVAETRHQLATEIFDGQLDRLTTIIRHGQSIINATCLACQGQGQFQNGEVCVVCVGEGKRHSPDTRIKAMKEVRAAIDQQAKMLGLYAPEKFAMTDAHGKDIDFHADLANLNDEELDRALSDFAAGVDAARNLAHTD